MLNAHLWATTDTAPSSLKEVIREKRRGSVLFDNEEKRRQSVAALTSNTTGEYVLAVLQQMNLG